MIFGQGYDPLFRIGFHMFQVNDKGAMGPEEHVMRPEKVDKFLQDPAIGQLPFPGQVDVGIISIGFQLDDLPAVHHDKTTGIHQDDLFTVA